MEHKKNESKILKEWEEFAQNIIKDHILLKQIEVRPYECTGDNSIKAKYNMLSEIEIVKKQKTLSNLINAAEPYMNYFSSSLGDIPHVIILSDKDGWIIDVKGNSKELDKNLEGLSIGTNYLGEFIGYSGIGTLMGKYEAIFIYGKECNFHTYKSVCSIETTIKFNGKAIGNIGICMPTEYSHPSNMIFILTCGSLIEHELCYADNKDGYLLNKKVSLMSNLMATTIHDLKNPLAIIRGIGQLGAMTTQSDKEKDYFKRIINQSDILNTMIVDFLSIVKPQNLTIVNLSSIISEIINEIQPICISKSITITTSIHSRKKCLVEKDLIKRCFINIIKNAVYVLDDGGKIDIEVKTKKDKVVVSISDNGPGIPKDLRDTLFEPFTHRSENGTGLGLFMAYHTVVDIHRGRIWFDTEEGKGTTFYIELPASTGI